MTCSDCKFWVRNPPDPNWVQADRHGTCSHPRRQFKGANKSWNEDDGCPYGSYQKTEDELQEELMGKKKQDPTDLDPPSMVAEGAHQEELEAQRKAAEPPKPQRRRRSDAGKPRTERRKQKGLLDLLEIAKRDLPGLRDELKAYQDVVRRVAMCEATIVQFGTAEDRRVFGLGLPKLPELPEIPTCTLPLPTIPGPAPEWAAIPGEQQETRA